MDGVGWYDSYQERETRGEREREVRSDELISPLSPLSARRMWSSGRARDSISATLLLPCLETDKDRVSTVYCLQVPSASRVYREEAMEWPGCKEISPEERTRVQQAAFPFCLQLYYQVPSLDPSLLLASFPCLSLVRGVWSAVWPLRGVFRGGGCRLMITNQNKKRTTR